MEYLKVMLVDDEDLVIEDIQALIDWEAHGFRVVGFAYNGRQAQRLVEEVQPDIIFMDVSLPDLDGISLSRKLQERLPEEQRAWGEQFCRRLRALRCVPVDVLVHNGDRFDWGGGCEFVTMAGF